MSSSTAVSQELGLDKNDPAATGEECMLLGGTPGALAQVALAVVVLGSLALKRYREHPKRPMKVWVFDVSKQGFSAVAAHLCGMLIAIIATRVNAGGDTSECAWYFVVFAVDTTLGVALALSAHNMIKRQAARWAGLASPAAAREAVDAIKLDSQTAGIALSVAGCGSYGTPPRIGVWAWQMLEWCLATITARIMCGIIVVGFSGLLTNVAGLLDKPFAGHPTAMLYTVMVLGPLGMNLIQVWIQDQVLKAKQRRAKSDGKDVNKSEKGPGGVLDKWP